MADGVTHIGRRRQAPVLRRVETARREAPQVHTNPLSCYAERRDAARGEAGGDSRTFQRRLVRRRTSDVASTYTFGGATPVESTSHEPARAWAEPAMQNE